MAQKGYSNKLSIELKFLGKSSSKDFKNMSNINIYSRYHKRITDWNICYRNKYAVNRWINDSRGCGMACKVAQRRFVY